jgi:hypothetical protein
VKVDIAHDFQTHSSYFVVETDNSTLLMPLQGMKPLSPLWEHISGMAKSPEPILADGVSKGFIVGDRVYLDPDLIASLYEQSSGGEEVRVIRTFDNGVQLKTSRMHSQLS